MALRHMVHQSLTAGAGAGIVLNFDAADAYLDVGGTGTVAAAVDGKKADIASLLDHLGNLVTGYGAEDARVNWGVDGSLGYVRERLMEAVQHLSGLERENIEDCLAEIRES